MIWAGQSRDTKGSGYGGRRRTSIPTQPYRSKTLEIAADIYCDLLQVQNMFQTAGKDPLLGVLVSCLLVQGEQGIELPPFSTHMDQYNKMMLL